ncbi:ATP-binding protein [Streptomyces sp. NBC_00280]|uniref:ATP-binding protein n=1 Tax=Streptomyces sp. NBC_00280 TaxID=2975699 RepID=UPI00352FA7F7
MSQTRTTTRKRVPPPRADEADQGAVETVIDEACRTLHLPTIRARIEEIAATAMRERSSYKDFLADLLEAECADREERRKQRLVREANFPRPKRLEDFKFEENPNVTPEMVGALADPAWVNSRQPLCLIGDSGTGSPTC